MNTVGDWRAFVDAQIQLFASIYGISDGFRPGTELIDEWFQNESRLHAARVDAIVKDFIATGRWPGMDSDEAFHVVMRLRMGQAVLKYCATTEYPPLEQVPSEGDPKTANPRFMRSPSLLDTEAFISWLLIEEWHLSETPWLRLWLHKFKQTPTLSPTAN